jgi:hypothetical protein
MCGNHIANPMTFEFYSYNASAVVDDFFFKTHFSAFRGVVTHDRRLGSRVNRGVFEKVAQSVAAQPIFLQSKYIIFIVNKK